MYQKLCHLSFKIFLGHIIAFPKVDLRTSIQLEYKYKYQDGNISFVFFINFLFEIWSFRAGLKWTPNGLKFFPKMLMIFLQRKNGNKNIKESVFLVHPSGTCSRIMSLNINAISIWKKNRNAPNNSWGSKKYQISSFFSFFFFR